MECNSFLSTPQMFHLHFTALQKLANSMNTKETRAGKEKLACRLIFGKEGNPPMVEFCPGSPQDIRGSIPGKGGANSLNDGS